MSLTPETIIQIQSMIQADPALLAEVQACADPASAAAVIAKAAKAYGMEIIATDLVAFSGAAVAKEDRLSEVELEKIAGGRGSDDLEAQLRAQTQADLRRQQNQETQDYIRALINSRQ